MAAVVHEKILMYLHAAKLQHDDFEGPKRELHQGAGYWSCDSPTTVMSLPDGASQLEIHWPGGTTTTSALPPGALEVRVALDGTVTRVR